ncbi:MAG: Hsp70 family protein, partial [Saprospiraceae bacterium]
MSIFSNEYCQYISTSVYSVFGDESFTETDLKVFQRFIAEWCEKNQLVADAIIEGDEIVVRAGHFSEDAGLGMQTTIFRDIVRDIGREIDKSFGFNIKETIKNPDLHYVENDSVPVRNSSPQSTRIMTRTRIDYGIDLGTTNSAIARLNGKEALIFKSDIQKDTVPSCVHFRKATIVVGERAFNRY